MRCAVGRGASYLLPHRAQSSRLGRGEGRDGGGERRIRKFLADEMRSGMDLLSLDWRVFGISWGISRRPRRPPLGTCDWPRDLAAHFPLGFPGSISHRPSLLGSMTHPLWRSPTLLLNVPYLYGPRKYSRAFHPCQLQ